MVDQPTPVPGAAPAPPAARKSPTVWPTVIGIISIIVGVGGLFMYGCFSPVAIFASLAMQKNMQASGTNMPGFEMQEAMIDAMRDYLPLTLVSYGLYAALAIVLLFAGIAMVRRRPAARPVALTWAVLKIVASGFGAFVGWTAQQANVEAIASTDGSGMMPANMGGFMHAAAVGTVIGSALYALALPVFILIWFNRRAIRDEVRSWVAPS